MLWTKINHSRAVEEDRTATRTAPLKELCRNMHDKEAFPHSAVPRDIEQKRSKYRSAATGPRHSKVAQYHVAAHIAPSPIYNDVYEERKMNQYYKEHGDSARARRPDGRRF